MKRYYHTLMAILLVPLFLLSGCGQSSSDSETSYDQGDLVSNSPKFSFSPTYITGIIAEIDTALGGAGASGLSADKDVRHYNIIYETKDPHGNSTKASAAVFAPNEAGDFPVMVYLHGSSSLDSSAPTNTSVDVSKYLETGNIADIVQTISSEVGFLIAMATQGKIIIVPDYLGFGESSGVHPYMLEDSLAITSIDAIKASTQLLASSTTLASMSDNIALTGYSEGGYAVMATHKRLVDPTLGDTAIAAKVKGVIPGAPPCDLSGTMVDTMINQTSYLGIGFLPYMLYSYDDVYSDIGATDILKSNYHNSFTLLETGTTSLGDITTDLGVKITAEKTAAFDATAYTGGYLLNDAYKTDLETGVTDLAADGTLDTATTYGLLERLMENDVHNYNPGAVPYYILHASNDEIVSVANAATAMTKLNTASSRSGATGILIVDPTNADANYRLGGLIPQLPGLTYSVANGSVHEQFGAIYFLTTNGLVNTLFGIE